MKTSPAKSLPDTAMHNVAEKMDKVMTHFERAGVRGNCGTKLNHEQDASVWLDQEDSLKVKLDNEMPKARLPTAANSSNPLKSVQHLRAERGAFALHC